MAHPPPRQDPAQVAAVSLVDNDSEVPIPRFPSRSALVLCGIADKVLLLRPMLSCLPSVSIPVFTLDLPRKLVADALLGMVMIKLLLLFLYLYRIKLHSEAAQISSKQMGPTSSLPCPTAWFCYA
jgi:hypothetical protein